MGEKEGFLPFPNFETLCIHHVSKLTKQVRKEKCPVLPPIVLSNLCKQANAGGGAQEYLQGRITNPTRSLLESLIASLNKTKFSLLFSSGMGAIMSVLGMLKCGDEVVCVDDIYGGTRQLLVKRLSVYGVKAHFVDFENLEEVQKSLNPNVKLFWVENPTNPKLKVFDLCAIAEIARKNKILTTVDNSLLTPYFQRPAEFGIDIAIQAMAKHVNGHSDVVMGAVSTNNEELYDKLKFIQTHFGHVPSPFDCYQVMRGLKTYPIRMKRHYSNSKKIVEYLMDHPKIEHVIYPGHCSHPQHDLLKKTASGMAGMVCFYIKGDQKDSVQFIKNLKLFYTAFSFGGYESLIGAPGFMSHKDVSDEVKKKMGYTPNFIRMSVGLEDPEDLIKDLEQSLSKLGSC